MTFWEWVGMAVAAGAVISVYFLVWHLLEALEFHRRYRHRR